MFEEFLIRLFQNKPMYMSKQSLNFDDILTKYIINNENDHFDYVINKFLQDNITNELLDICLPMDTYEAIKFCDFQNQ